VLARAGVGRIILIDPDSFAASNLERVHGSEPNDIEAATLKVKIAQRHIHSIDPTIEVEAFVGRVPQMRIIDALLKADIVLGCTDSHATRIALGDLSWQYLLPILDVGVALEGKQGNISGQVIQIVYFGPDRPCALCQKMYSAERITYELMSEPDKATRKAAAAKAIKDGADPSPYWRDYPQLNTVGYLTTTAGAMIAGYAIGIVTGRFVPPFTRIQIDLVAPLLGTVDQFYHADKNCSCQTKIGWGMAAAASVNVSAPAHWPSVKVINLEE